MLTQALISQFQQLMPQEGVIDSQVPGVTLARSDVLTQRAAITYQPILYFVLQGQKTSYLGDESYRYDPLNFLATSVPLPMEGHVTSATPEQPYLAIKVRIDPVVVRELLTQLPSPSTLQNNQRGVFVSAMNQDLVSSLTRLVTALADPLKAPVLGPLVIKEMLFHVLLGPQGPQVAAFVTQGKLHQRIAKVIDYIQLHYDQPLDVDTLASIANMSSSSLHQHFKSVTNSSPLQYLKAIRLHQANSLVSIERIGVSEAAYRVGYQSLSQFSREFKRQFGYSPSTALEV